MTAQELELLWDQRSTRYAMRRSNSLFRPVSDAEYQSIIAWRRKEVEMLPAKERLKALTALAQWQPPRGK